MAWFDEGLPRVRSVRGDHASIGKQLTGVVEEHDSVAQQAPALFGMGGYRAGGSTVRGRRGGAPGGVVTGRRSGGGGTGRFPTMG
jgi:hypothetical protein